MLGLLFVIWNTSKVWNHWILGERVLTSHHDLDKIDSEGSSFIHLVKNLG
jgi:hypothetical protein